MYKRVRLILIALAAAAVAVAIVVVALTVKRMASRLDGVSVSVAPDSIEKTPILVSGIRKNEKWAFLAVSDEELVDTTRKGFFNDDHLVMTFVATLRLGIDLRQARPDWIAIKGDTVRLKLPPITLLQDDFIDDSQARVFHKNGTWNGNAKAALRSRAKTLMIARAMNRANVSLAERNAERHFRTMIESMGYGCVEIEIASADDYSAK